MSNQLEKLLRDAVYDGVIECPKCGKALESDAESCYKSGGGCGWKNTLIEGGFI